MNINLNEYVQVKLTEYGKRVHFDYWYDKPIHIRSKFPYRQPIINEQGYSKFQLWDLMSIFGPVLHLGNPNVPFEGNEIVYDN